MKELTTKEIVNKLIGKIRPVGETNTDNDRFENLENLCELVSELVSEIDSVAYDYKDSIAFSEKRASDYAKKFLTQELGINEFC